MSRPSLVALALCALPLALPAQTGAPVGGVPPAASPPAAESRPAAVDLRDELTRLGIRPRHQGHRPTCSVFTVASALDVAYSRAAGHPTIVSVEFLNWAKNQVRGGTYDGGFFHDILAGFERHAVCLEALFPYRRDFDPTTTAPAPALADARERGDALRDRIVLHWIRPWAKEAGIDDTQFATVKSVLARHWPVATGSNHSRLLVGYRDDPTKPGGGIFITQDSGSGSWGEVTYEFVKTGIFDAFWIESLPGSAETRAESRPAKKGPAPRSG